jgi:hypothetical protein
MLIIVSLWVVSLKYFLPTNQESEATGEISQSLEKIKKETPSLKEAFKASIGAFFEKDLEEELKESVDQTQLNNLEEDIIQFEKKLEVILPAKLPLSR